MSADATPVDLTNHFLIAMPGLNDELFGRSVVYICEHSAKGALGLIVNKPAGLTLGELFERLELPLARTPWASQPVLRGGPLQMERGFVLHDDMGTPVAVGPSHPPTSGAPVADDEAAASAPATVYASSLKVAGAGLELTTSRDVLEAVSVGAGPRRLLLALGYSSWGEGQLESELADNAWLTVPADPAILFEVPLAQRYERAMALLGVQPWMLTPGAGRA
ncbi:MAG: YqgE/AlgH family protein [Tepidimonas sp.]|uniref:YqgE/AlgH family protein n=1 Tax=Tepidimonas sp. TaxID=2002775 RepID=UPI00298EE1CE|nr:YqgE/AlgH family protein [Tepidimonas sp.]MDW8336559.1 YqgE/AlgH family protein [Tepidimonas sp.]